MFAFVGNLPSLPHFAFRFLLPSAKPSPEPPPPTSRVFRTPHSSLPLSCPFVVCPQIKPKKISYQFCANAGASGESACRPHKLFPLIHGDLLLPFIVGVIFHYRGVVTGYRRERGFFHSLEEMKFCFSTQFIGVFSKGMKTRLRDISSINR